MTSRRAAPPAALAVAIAGVTIYVLRYALRTTNFLNDEYGAVMSARLAGRDPLWALTATDGFFARGPERLGAFVMAVPDVLLSPTSNGLRGMHVILAIAYFLTAVPAYALLRGLGAQPWPAVLFAVLSIATPWALFGATLLNVTLAAPLTVAFCWAAWKTAVEPALRWDVLVVVLAGLNAGARASHAAFAVVAVVAALAAVWWRRDRGEPRLRALRMLPRRFARTHPVLAVAALAGLVVIAVVGPGELAGGSYEHIARYRIPPLSSWSQEGGLAIAQLTIATGFLAVLVGGPWLLREAVRPRDLRSGAFALIALGVFLMYVFVAALAAPEPQERYVAPLAALPVIAFGAAVCRREAWLVGTVVVGVVVGRALAVHGPGPTSESLNYFFAPARLFFGRVILGRVETTVPFAGGHAVTAAAIGAVILAAVVAAAWSPRLRERRVPPAIAAALALAVTLPAGIYVLDRYEPATRPGDLDEMAWIDRVTDERPAVIWNYGWEANQADRNYFGRLGLLHNATACCAEYPRTLDGQVAPDGSLPQTTEDAPEYVVSFPGFKPVAFAATAPVTVRGAGADWRLQRFGDGARAAAVIQGPAADGTLTEAGARIRVTPAARGCLVFDMNSPVDATERMRFTAGERRGTVLPGRAVTVRLPARPGTVAVRGPGLSIGEASVAGC